MKTYKILLSFFLILTYSFGFSQPVPTYVATNGLVGWWGFNGNAQDGSGNGNHGTINGTTLTTDRFGNLNAAYYFNGSNNFIQIPNSATLNPNYITISGWINIAGYAFNEQNGARAIITKWYQLSNCGGLGDSYNFQLSAINSQNVLAFSTNANSQLVNSVNSSNYAINLNNWYHFAVINSPISQYVYVNGSLVASISGSLVICPTTNDLYIGADNFQGTLWRHFNGTIDDIGIWNRALTPQEINNLYNSQLPIQTSLCLPTITTSSPSSVGVDTVVIGGNISNDGGSSIILRGICYSTSPNPNMGNERTENGSGIGSYNAVLRGLISYTTYYARSYAKNSSGVVVYGNEVSFTTSASLPGARCPGTLTVTDIDGNIYNTVQIGMQCWTQSNLKTSKYRNGDNIPTVLSNSVWQNTTSGAYAIYNNDPVNDSLYGKLYNHYTVRDSRGLCPTGWHVPTDGEWNVLGKFLDPNADTLCIGCHHSIVAGGMMKNIATQPTLGGWNFPNTGATNSSGFSGSPGGFFYSGGFGGLGDIGHWWSSSFDSSGSAGTYYVFSDNAWVNRDYIDTRSGLSVRCLKNTLPQVNTSSITNLTSSSALVIGEVISEGGDQNTTRGFCYTTTSNPTISNDTTINGYGHGVYSVILQNMIPLTTYYIRAYAMNSMGTSYGNVLIFTPSPASTSFTCGTSTVSDVDNNTYTSVQIGYQCLTQSNLKVTRYRNGDAIPTGLSNSAWQNTTSGAYAIYNNSPVNDFLYGKLYNHYAVTDSRGLCPTGWHVPTDGEWMFLVNNLGGLNVAGGSLKSIAMQPTPGGWSSPNTGATNSSGFTALPGGVRGTNGGFGLVTDFGYLWSSSVVSGYNAWNLYLNSVSSNIGRLNFSRAIGFSVRCFRD